MAELSRISLPAPEMDPMIWNRLPEVILEHVLSFLPLKIFWTLRSTCKHFKSLQFSSDFISKHSSSSPPIFSFILLSHPQFDRKYALYDSSLHVWKSPPRFLSCIPSSSLLASSHGLLCFSLSASSSFLIHNIISSSSTIVQLPSTPFPFYLLTLVLSPNGFKIFTLESSSGRAFVYHSENQAWHQFDRIDGFLIDHSQQEGAYFNGSLYFPSQEPFSVIRFNLENGNWDRPRFDLPGDLVFGRLLSNGDEKLYLIGGIGLNGISRMMKVWELVGGDKWVEVTSVPEAMCRKFMAVCYHNYEHVYCFWHEDLICVCCYTWPEILYLKVSRRRWHWLSKCPLLPERWSCGFRWFSLVPNLHASLL
ncbi:F-box/kelch-repeat protein At5g43190 [Impatiens glandulifera]|uniref:F-box/kelch-repeat protein At5g43190 n=1 Tax=Impatiens glandulifera TaxID=253017 RepID=UPI001FB0E7D2|nr:F-box/kelch-repeat protein At5g43190 [Impatiens glandulifera]